MKVVRPRETLRPTSAQSPAGKRIDPAPSAALAIGRTRAATALAEPPLDPPGVRSGCQGLRVSPKSGDSVCEPQPHSGAVVLATSRKPAAFALVTDPMSKVDT